MDIRKEIEEATDNLAIGYYDRDEFYDKILSLMGEKELGGSDALPSNGDLHSVRECNASGEVSNKKASVNGSLEKITDTENK